jgi:acylphosphatase
MRVARHYLVSGRVQGVGFRFFTAEAARDEQVHGWVRNLPDGRVEIVAEGEAGAIERFERRVRRGPSAGHVDEVEAADRPVSNVETFTVK